MQRLPWTAAVLTFALAGCGSPQPAQQTETPSDTSAPTTPATDAQGLQATALLRTADGLDAGRAVARAGPDGQVTVMVDAQGLPPGPHGVHVHTTGRCDGPTFETAGGHWNPANAQHGLEPPPGQHAGDMPNLVVGQDGRGSLEYQLVGATFEGLLDSDGSAFMVHASADNQRTDPSGDSGDRIACGVFERG